MKKEKIYKCEVERLHQVNEKRFLKWVTREVSQIIRGESIRYYECKGLVRLHKKRSINGPNDHVEHLYRSDSENCPLGFYYKGKKDR